MPEKERERGGLPVRCSECTRRCRSRQHADLVSAAITKAASDAELISYLSWVCHSAASCTDSAGRTPLHVAASCGRTQLVEWLVRVRGVSLDTEDAESGMTALQRAVFYGQLGVARTLLMLGASAVTLDHADMTAYDGAHADRLPLVELTPAAPCEAYVWGSNPWFSIGVERIKARSVPEPLDVFRRAGVWIRQIVMTKFHTAFVTQGGEVYTCGHGIGGRLAHGDEESVLAPRQVKAVRGERCVQVAASADHTVLLMESGAVWTCGLNQACQLGHSPPPAQLTAPRLMDWSRARPDRITGVCAARYHTVLWNADSLYCVGLNGGQLGQHKDENADKRLILPRKVTMLDRSGSGGLRLTHVACSDGATAVATGAGDVFLLTDHRCRRVASRLLNLRQLRVAGGAPDTGPLPGGRSAEQRSAAPLRLLLITAAGQLLIWHQDWPTVTRCVIGLRRQLCVADAELDRHGLILISETGQAFTGTVVHDKQRQSPPKQTKADGRRGAAAAVAGPVPCAQLCVTRVPHIHRAVSVTCDGSGANAAAVQCDPRAFLLEVPQVSPSQIRSDLAKLLENTDETDSIHDVVLLAGRDRLPCHRYILASGSSFFSQQLGGGGGGGEGGDGISTLRLEGVQSSVLRQVVQFLYTGTCDLLRPGPTDFRLESTEKPSEPAARPQKSHHGGRGGKGGGQKAVQPVQVVRDVARRLGVPGLHARLEGVRLTGGRVEVPRGFDASPASLQLDPSALPALSDVTVVSSDGVSVPCHKCVLAARLQYFSMMLASCWAESAASEPVRLSVPAVVLTVLLHYCYTDEARLQPDDSEQLQTDDLELLCGLLAAADHMLADRLKHICEVALSRQLTLKNAVELMEFSAMYGADQLKTTSMQFICLNLAAVMENRTLDQASDEVMDQLTRYYRSVNPLMAGRQIRPSAAPPDRQLISAVHQAYPMCADQPAPPPPADEEARCRPPPRRRPAGRRTVSGDSGSRAAPEQQQQQQQQQQQRERAVSTSSVASVTSLAELEVTSEDGDALDLSDLVERQHSSPVPEFTLVTRRRHPERSAEPAAAAPAAPAPAPAGEPPGRYIPGMTPKPRPARAAQPVTRPDSPELPPGDVTADQSPCSADLTSPIEAFPSLGSAFPALGGDVIASAAGSPTSPISEKPAEIKRTSKKGRRGRPLALDGSLTVPAAAPACPAADSPTSSRAETPRRPAWTSSPTEPCGASLADIMAQQREVVVTARPAAAPAARPPRAVAAPAGPPARSGDSVWGSASPPVVNGGGPLATSPPPLPPPGPASLTDIIRQEQQRIESRQLMRDKSLALIQIEERAIQELLGLYGAADCCTARITVSRVQADTAEPRWHRQTLTR